MSHSAIFENKHFAVESIMLHIFLSIRAFRRVCWAITRKFSTLNTLTLLYGLSVHPVLFLFPIAIALSLSRVVARLLLWGFQMGRCYDRLWIYSILYAEISISTAHAITMAASCDTVLSPNICLRKLSWYIVATQFITDLKASQPHRTEPECIMIEV